VSRFHRNATRLRPGTTPSPFAPLLTLQHFGYRWAVASPDAAPKGRYEPAEHAVIGPWLAPPTERFSILAVCAREAE
jgi:hypothetical protein